MQLKIIEIYTSGCFLYCKDTKMKANHNDSSHPSNYKIDVSYIAKILK